MTVHWPRLVSSKGQEQTKLHVLFMWNAAGQKRSAEQFERDGSVGGMAAVGAVMWRLATWGQLCVHAASVSGLKAAAAEAKTNYAA